MLITFSRCASRKKQNSNPNNSCNSTSFPFPRIFTHLTTYNIDRLSVEEAKEALEDAPIISKPGLRGLESPEDSWIDYLLWIEKFAGFRKPNMRLYLN